MLPATPHFLLIDDDADSRYLLVKTLLRKFPRAVIHECQSSDAALAMAKDKRLAAIVTHRTVETAGLEMVAELRAVNPTIPIVMVSGVHRGDAPEVAGADCFLHYDEWLRIGTIVEDLMYARAGSRAPFQSRS